MKHDGFAFPTPDFRESEHSLRVADSVPSEFFKTETTALAVNGQGAAHDFVNSADSKVRGMIWTPEADARLRELFDEGLTDLEIGAALGCGSTAVKTRRQKIRLLRPTNARDNAPDAPTDRYPTGPAIDAMFRAAERPSRATSYFDCATGKVRPLARMAA